MTRELLQTAEINERDMLEELIRQLLKSKNLEAQRIQVRELAEALNISLLDCAAALFYFAQKECEFSVPGGESIYPIDFKNFVSISLKPEIPIIVTDTFPDVREQETITPRIRRINYIAQPIKMARYRLEIGKKHQLTVKELKKVLIEESGVDKNNINNVMIHPDYTLLELPDDMPQDIFQHLKTVEINHQKLSIKRLKTKNRKHRQRGGKRNIAHKIVDKTE